MLELVSRIRGWWLGLAVGSRNFQSWNKTKWVIENRPTQRLVRAGLVQVTMKSGSHYPNQIPFLYWVLVEG
jgi:hypothetical protein